MDRFVVVGCSVADPDPSRVSAQATVLVMSGARPVADPDVADGQWVLDAPAGDDGRPVRYGRRLRVGVRPHAEFIRATVAAAVDRDLGDVVRWCGVVPTWRTRVTGEVLLARLVQQSRLAG